MQGTSDPLNQVEISSEEKEFSFKDLISISNENILS